MRIRFRKKTLALTTPLALAFALAACGEPAETGEDDLPDPEIAAEPDNVTDEEIEEAVPGIEEAYSEGDTPNTADIDSRSDAEYQDIEDNPPEQ